LAQLSLNWCRLASLQQIGHFFPTMARAAFQPRFFAQRGHDLLAWSSGGANGFDERPILVRFTLDRPTITANEHARQNTAVPADRTTGGSPLHKLLRDRHAESRTKSSLLPMEKPDLPFRLTNLG